MSPNFPLFFPKLFLLIQPSNAKFYSNNFLLTYLFIFRMVKIGNLVHRNVFCKIKSDSSAFCEVQRNKKLSQSKNFLDYAVSKELTKIDLSTAQVNDSP